MNRVPVETIRRGDEVWIPRLGPHVVSAVNEGEDGRYVVVYFAHDEETYENKARDSSGRNSRVRICERSLKPHAAGELLSVSRGADNAAVQLRAQMEQEQRERWTATAERWARAAAADRRRAER